MILLLMTLAAVFGGVLLGIVAFITIASAWNAMTVGKHDADISGIQFFDWEREEM